MSRPPIADATGQGHVSLQPKADTPTVAVLSYHKIGPPSPGGWDTWYYVPESTFEAHLKWLCSNGWTLIDLPTFLRGLDSPDRLPERAALLTFDDAYRSVAERARPVMARYEAPGVVFVPTRFVGGTNEFDRDTREPPEPICSWQQLEQLEQAGVSIQSHGVSHRAFSDLPLSEIEEELAASKEALEKRIGEPVDVFAFPYGDAGTAGSEVALALQRCGYRAACLYGGGPLRLPVDDVFGLSRLAVGRDSDLSADLAP